MLKNLFPSQSHYYRPDIDGLRAIAVISVVLYHAFPTIIYSGFIGVDIFFVISGFLISSIIFKKLHKNNFSFLDFYSRRIRRIFPSLLTIMIFCLFFGWLYLTADELKYLSKHLAAGSTFSSNFLLWSESGYFDKEAHLKPLLHLWSLAIEEQFYILYPLILYSLWRFKLSFPIVICLLLVLSFTANIFFINTDKIAVFYNPLTRIWELLSGSLLAYLTVYKTDYKKFLLNKKISINSNFFQLYKLDLFSLLGIIFFIISFIVINPERNFPGYISLLIILGTCFFVVAGPNAFINKHILSNRLLVFFGLISFPLYLWHWILFTFSRMITGDSLGTTFLIILITLSILLSIITYLFIEKPLRFGGGWLKTSLITFSMFLVIIVSSFIFYNDGFIQREKGLIEIKNDGDIGHDDFHMYNKQNFFPCSPDNILDKALRYKDLVRCYQSKKDKKIDIAVVGDSHAEHLYIGIAESLKNYNVVNYIQNATPSINNKYFRDIFRNIRNDENIKLVVLNAYWIFRSGRLEKDTNLKKEVDETIRALISSGKNVLLVGDTPTFVIDPSLCKYSRKLRNDESKCIASSKGYSFHLSKYIENFKLITNKYNNAYFLNLENLFCDDGFCYMSLNNKLLYRDPNHLNINGSKYAGKEIAKVINQIKELK